MAEPRTLELERGERVRKARSWYRWACWLPLACAFVLPWLVTPQLWGEDAFARYVVKIALT